MNHLKTASSTRKNSYPQSRCIPLPEYLPFEVQEFGNFDGPCIVVCGGITASTQLTATADQAQKAWWEEVVGSNLALDTDQYRLLAVCPSQLPSNFQSEFSIAAQAGLIAELLEYLQIEQLRCFVGCSYGGMLGLEIASQAKINLQQLVLICAPHQSHAFATAGRILQRRLICLASSLSQKSEALSIARGLALLTYRTENDFEQRFGGLGQKIAHDSLESYLSYQGSKYSANYTVDESLAFSQALDQHCVSPSEVKCKTSVIAVRSDRLVPIAQLEDLAEQLPNLEGFYPIESDYGHDAFLKEQPAISELLRKILKGESHA